MTPKFLRTKKGYYVYEFDCPRCGTAGEVGVPVRSQEVFDHGCGMLYIQVLPRGTFGEPRLIEVSSERMAAA
jgi:hypothetical protein